MKQKTYLHWGVTITAAACAILVFYDTFFQDGVLFIFIEKLFGILKPVLYGLAMAYLLTPIVDFFRPSPPRQARRQARRTDALPEHPCDLAPLRWDSCICSSAS